MEPALPGMMVKLPKTSMSNQVNYKVVKGWEQLPKGFAHRNVAGVAVNRRAVST